MNRSRLVRVALAAGVIAAVLPLSGCQTDARVVVTDVRLVPVGAQGAPPPLVSRPGEGPFLLPSGVAGFVEVTFTADHEFAQCTLTMDGAQALAVRTTEPDAQKRFAYYVRKPTVALVPDDSATGLLDCRDTFWRGSNQFRVQVPRAATTLQSLPRWVSFRNVPLGGPPARLSLALGNYGSAPITIREAWLVGPDAASFTLDDRDCTKAALRTARWCEIQVQFAATGTGLKRAVILVTVTGTSVPFDAALVTGAAVGAPQFSVHPASLDFGTLGVGAPSAPLTVNAGNVGGAPLQVSGARITGPDAADFTIDPAGCLIAALGEVWEPGTGCTSFVVFLAHSAGSKRATLEYLGTGGSLLGSVALTGVGELSGGGTPP